MTGMRKCLIGITGGIGAGKSVVSRMLRLKGYPVYDCDSRAKVLMEESAYILTSLKSRLGEECVLESGELNRALIAERVFSCEEERLWLNSLVHAEVRKDITEWTSMFQEGPVFVESAIMVTSGLDRMCDSIMLVDAPETLRVKRALQRGGSSLDNIVKRISAQKEEFASLSADKTVSIDNGGSDSLLFQIEKFLENLESVS